MRPGNFFSESRPGIISTWQKYITADKKTIGDRLALIKKPRQDKTIGAVKPVDRAGIEPGLS